MLSPANNRGYRVRRLRENVAKNRLLAVFLRSRLSKMCLDA